VDVLLSSLQHQTMIILAIERHRRCPLVGTKMCSLEKVCACGNLPGNIFDGKWTGLNLQPLVITGSGSVGECHRL